MKKLIVLSLVLGTFLATGCSVELDPSSSIIESKSAKLEAKAEVLQQEFDLALDLVNELEDKDEINSKDQERIANQIEIVLAVVNEFKEVETPVIGKKVKDFAGDNLKSRIEILSNVQKNAEEGTATKDDLQKMEKALSNDVNINLFN